MATATVPEKAPEQVETPDPTQEIVKELQALRVELKEAQRPVKDTKAVMAGAEKVAATAIDMDEAKRFGWKSMGEQLLAIRNYAVSRAMDKRLNPSAEWMQKAATGLGEAIDSDGGFLLAPQFAEGIREIMHAEENLLDRTDSMPTSSNNMTLRAIDETSRATGSRRGGVRGYWADEGDPLVASKPKFRKIRLEVHKLTVLVYATEELLEDAGPGLESYVQKAAAEEINFLTGDAILNGEGAGKPQGILSSLALVTVAKEAGQPALTIVPENIAEMWKRLHASARSNAIWLINQDTERQLDLMNVALGTAGQLLYMPPGGLTAARYATLRGRPVIETEFNPTLGTVGDIVLCDMKQYLTVVKSGGIRSAMSMHVEFLTDQMVYRFTYRVDGQTWWNSVLTPFKGAATQSPFVALATRA